MYLTQEEQAMLDGAQGDGTAEAMRLLVRLGESMNAQKMVPISRAHTSAVHYPSDIWYTTKLIRGGAKCKIPPTINPLYDLDYFEKIGKPDPAGEKDLVNKARDIYCRLGVIPTYSCTPELDINVPRTGEFVAFAESSATPYVNAVCGARSNRESAKTALAAAITGRTPLYGYLLDENRRGTVLVKVDAPVRTGLDYNLAGYAIGEKMGAGVPVITGLPENPMPEELLNLGTQLATSSSVAMYHIPGVTPEAPDVETAFHGRPVPGTITVTRADLEGVKEKLSCARGPIEYVMVGCPHYTLGQVIRVAEQIKGRKVHPDVTLWILTSSRTRELAEKMGYLGAIEQAGGHVIAGTCFDFPCYYTLYSGKSGVTDSAKAAFYTPRMKMDFNLETRKRCIEIALNGGY
ncbi:MAG: aconitase X catalytic domain-containing protein [Desulfobacterales bacterium]|nr:aconitase X catalytic domain-containing protein [Desulfobacterales bacterium]